ncbi:MAG: hypothetical protein HFJ66_01955 [Eggerthellaceae bacterium]|nr:hypothetical protein [Eggerthellaceae bacterium]
MGGALLSEFGIDPFLKGGVFRREAVMTPESLAELIEEQPVLAGSKRAKELSAFIGPGAYSPPEVFLKLVFSLPMAKGGLAIPGIIANWSVPQSPKGKTVSGRDNLVLDLYQPDSRIAIEYDSDAMHFNRGQAAKDSSKRLALEEAGIKVIAITTAQLRDGGYLRAVGETIYAHMGRRFRIRSKNFPTEWKKLLAAGSSLAFLLDPMWVRQRMVEGEEARKRDYILTL